MDLSYCEKGLFAVSLCAAPLIGGRVDETPRWTSAIVPGAYFYNRVFNFAPSYAGDIADLRAAIEKGKAAENVYISGADLTPEREELMKAEGFEVFAEQSAMSFDLSKEFPAPLFPISQIGPQRAREWAACVNTAIGKEDAPELFAALAERPEFFLFAVEDEGRIVSTLMLSLAHGIACMHEGGTYSEYRGRGCISSLMLHCMALAKKRGFRHIGLQASPMGAPVYEKLGYVNHGQMKHWHL
ncbi:MAG: GNAT family N-acetyltransferase [Oscillospiraceae bacterium]|jgi:GNAT superfamily N-acetyltransferase